MSKKLQPVFSNLCYFLFHQHHAIRNIISAATIDDLDDISCKTCLQLKIFSPKNIILLNKLCKKEKRKQNKELSF